MGKSPRNPNPHSGGNSNPGGPGGHRGRIPTGGGGIHKKKGCCSMAAAVRSVRQGKFRLARRYAVMSVRLIAARLV